MIGSASLGKWTVGSLIVLLAAAAASFFWVDHQLRRFAGAYTDVVDHAGLAPSRGVTTIANVNVLSPDGTAMIGGQTVVFDRDGIISITDALERSSQDVSTVDGSGHYLIPGLVDSHVHLKQSPNDLLLYVANGVTQVREMSGNADHLRWRNEIKAGRLGPRIFVASEKLGSWGWSEGRFQRWTRNRINVNTDDDVAALTRSMSEDGFDAIKLGSLLDKDVYRQVNSAAERAGIPVIGHLPVSVGLEDLWSSGQDEVGHIEEIAKALDAEFGYFNSRNAHEYLAFVEVRSGDVAEKLANHGIAVTSSLWLMESIPRQKFELDVLLDEIQLVYANPGLVEGTPLSRGWLPGNNAYALGPDASAAEREANRIYWTTFAKAHHVLLAAMRDKGVQLMAGTDANNAGAVPGYSLHDELQSMTRAGLSPVQALRAARCNHGAGRLDESPIRKGAARLPRRHGAAEEQSAGCDREHPNDRGRCRQRRFHRSHRPGRPSERSQGGQRPQQVGSPRPKCRAIARSGCNGPRELPFRANGPDTCVGTC
ncbi:MAG: amidohydrolase [Pseudomonadota bacterium]|nr:amidohydrolase [Pseudomonadota bacterium]